MLDLGCYDVLPFFAVESRQSLQDHIVAFCGAGCEDDLLGVCANEAGDLGPGGFDRCGSVPTVLVVARVRVAVIIQIEGHHGVEDAVVKGSGGLVVEIDDFAGGETGPQERGTEEAYLCEVKHIFLGNEPKILPMADQTSC